MKQFYKGALLWVSLGLFMLLLFHLFNTPQPSEEELIFSEFMSRLENGEVNEVVIKENHITGRLNDGKRFRTYNPDYPNLVKDLREKGVRIFAKPPDENSWYINFLLV